MSDRENERTRALFISWIDFHGRSDGLARELEIESWFTRGGRIPVPVRYMRQWSQTVRVLRAKRPEVIVIVQPPIFALWSIWAYARRSGARIAGDLHTGTFDDPRWWWVRRHTFRLLRRYGVAVVTNEALKAVAEDSGCPAICLHDLIEAREPDLSPFDDVAVDPGGPFVLVPLAYAYDEPVDELLAAAAAQPDVHWVFTGRAPRRVRRAAAPNVTFSGFVSTDDYYRLVSRACAVVGITKHEHTMQRTAYEALCFARPLVTSDTKVLSEYYGGAATIVAPRGDAIAEGVRKTIFDEGAVGRMANLRTRRIDEQHVALDRLRDWIFTGDRQLDSLPD